MVRVAQHQPHHRQQHQNPHQLQLHALLVQLQLQPVGLVSYNPCTLYTQLQPVFIGWMPFKLIKILELLTKCRMDQSAS